MLSLDEARQAKKEVIEILKECPQVEGIGIAPTAHGYSVKVNVSAPLPPNLDQKLYGVVGKESVWIDMVGQAIAY